MLLQYHPDSDMLHIRLADGITHESEEVAPGIVIDFDSDSHIIGIQIEDASKSIDLSRLEISALPIVNLIVNREATITA